MVFQFLFIISMLLPAIKHIKSLLRNLNDFIFEIKWFFANFHVFRHIGETQKFNILGLLLAY